MSANASLKQRIRSGETVVGAIAQAVPDRGRLERILDSDSYDFVSIDSQHAPYDEDRLVAFCAIAHELGVHVQFRIKHTRNAYLIGNYLDLGPSGVEVPQVEEDATVQDALDSFYFPQVGKRSWVGGARVGAKKHPDRLEYAEWWNGYGVLWMQIESVPAITNARRFARPGVDCLSFGPADLSFSLEGHPGHPFKTVDDCVRHVVKQLEDSDVRVCFRHYKRELRSKYIDMGVTVLLESPEV